MIYKLSTKILCFAYLSLCANGIQNERQTCELIKPRGGVFEVYDLLNCDMYISLFKLTAEDEELFETWSPRFGWIRHPVSIRHVTTEETCAYASPGNEEKVITKLNLNKPYESRDWLHMANICPSDLKLGGCFPEPCDILQAKAGSLKVVRISKCHRLVWRQGSNVTFLTDQDGVKHILVVTSSKEQAESGILDPVPQLPEGWTLTYQVLEEDLDLSPEGHSTIEIYPGGQKNMAEIACGYTILFDQYGNNFHRIEKTTDIENLEIHLIFKGNTFIELAYLVAGIATLFFIFMIVLCWKKSLCCFKIKTHSKKD